jgi:SAM-dependent methyltransferase
MANLCWDDSDVLPAVLSRDTEFVFARMTEETLRAVHADEGLRILDVGCGRAIDAASMARTGALLFGGEPSRVMLAKARKWATDSGSKVLLVSHLAEELPFKNKSFSRVVCKGAIDHFLDSDQAIAEMGRVTSPGGKVVISVANFESLSCFTGRGLNRFFLRRYRKEIPGPHIWEIPRDHTFKFDYPTLLNFAGRHLQVHSVKGVSLLWGFPLWPRILTRLPSSIVLILLHALNTMAIGHPPWSDVLVLTGSPREGFTPRSTPKSASAGSRNEMNDTSRFWGGVLCAVILIVAILFLWGIAQHSYWALAIPVAVGFLGILALGFWIGWTIATIKTTPPASEPSSPSAAAPTEPPPAGKA